LKYHIKNVQSYGEGFQAQVDKLINENPQPSEVVDLRVSLKGLVYPTARVYITSLEQRIEELENTISEMVNNE
jgi:hypothetical protein